MTKDCIPISTTSNKPIIALDCDGVLLDYNLTFPRIYEKTFGKQIEIVSPKSYHVSQIVFTKTEYIKLNHL